MRKSPASLFPFADLNLARRLERAEALSNVDFVEARRKVFPDSGAEWLGVAGAYAMFDGVSSPLTQSFGLGLFQPVTAAELDSIEQFFLERKAEVFHEVCPLADPSLRSLLNERGYQPIEFTSVMYRPIESGVETINSRDNKILVRLINNDEQELWTKTSAQGWSEFPELVDFLKDIGQVSARQQRAHSFLAELDGQPVATGVLIISEGIALLAGASTIPEGRKQGAQLALLEHRLRYGSEHGCDLAMMGAEPGSASQRNAERHGFRIAYTRIKWQLFGVR